MFARILVAIDDLSQCEATLDLVKNVAAEGVTEVRALHLRVRELSGYKWYSPETRDQASLVAEATTFELRMAGLAAGGIVRHVPVDRVAQAILREAKTFDAQLIVLGSPRRGACSGASHIGSSSARSARSSWRRAVPAPGRSPSRLPQRRGIPPEAATSPALTAT
jgi:nucleotide-binding universal stress UspA family protein